MTSKRTLRRPGDPGYPTALQRTQGPRAKPLAVLGELEEDLAAVAIVGARRATAGAVADAERLARELVGAGLVVVSGGAYGVDAAAHRGALSVGGRTVAVLGTGLDVVYPERHRELFDQIVASGGALVSPFPDGTPPRASNFVARNAIISGMSRAVVVIEAELRSGSLTTARWARVQGKLLGAMAGSSGTARLLGQGAFVVRSAADVLDAIAGTQARSAPAVPDGEVTQVWQALPAQGGVDQESLAVTVGLPLRAVTRALSRLELLGLATVAPGRRYQRTVSPSAHIARGSCG